MNRLMTILAALSALLGVAPFVRPTSRAGQVFLWVPKLLGGALSPLSGLLGALAALIGLAGRDWRLVGTGLLGAGLAARLAADLPDVDRALAELPGPAAGDLAAAGPGRPGHSARPEFDRDVVVGRKLESGRPLRADLWLPAGRPPSGMGLIYVHGSGWRVGDKDLGTRPFFRRLAAQGHLVLDIAYSLWPDAGLPAMVAEVNQAILWLKECGPAYGVDPQRSVVMGGSAGGHLALLAAYTPGHPAFRPAGASGDTSVRGVVAFYPPVDLLAMAERADSARSSTPGPLDRLTEAMIKRLFNVHEASNGRQPIDNMLVEMVGGTPAQMPGTFRLLSPLYHVSSDCPPTLLLQGSDDVFGLAPGVRRLRDCLRDAGVPVALLEFPHTEHAFDLLLPRLSPAARAATRAVERFLAGLS